MENFSERLQKLIHRELQSQFVETLTCKDIMNVSKDMHKARCSQLLPLPTVIEEIHETLFAVQVCHERRERKLSIFGSF
jgi:hypothetical protein